MKSETYFQSLFAQKSLCISKRIVVFIVLTCLFFQAPAQNWFQVTSGTQNKLNTISFPSANVGYIGGNDSLLLKTIDGGTTWAPVNFTGVNFLSGGADILNLQFLSPNVGFMTVGPYSGSYGTTDGGLTWTQIALPGNHCFNRGMYFFDEYNGFIGGSGCFQSELISYVSNTLWSAGTWSSSTVNNASFNSNDMVTDIDFHNTNYGLAGSRSGYIFRTIDGGLNWDSAATPQPLSPVTSVLIVDDTIAYASYELDGGGGFGGLYISNDAGLTWNFDNASITFFYPDFMTLHKSGNQTIYTGGVSSIAQGLIFNKPENVSFWNYDIVDEKINDIASYNDSIVFAVGDSGYIVKNIPLITSLIENNETSQATFTIYPNPTSDVFTIEFDSENASNLTKDRSIEIVDVTGRKVYESDFKIDVAPTTIDVSQLNSGIYHVRIFDGNEIHSKKLIVE